MPVTLATCVAEVLCGLGNAALTPIRAVLTAQVAVLQAFVGVLQAQLLSLEFITTPISTLRDLAQTAIDLARAQLSSLPIPANSCVDIGRLYELLDRAARLITQPLDDFKAWVDIQLDRLDVLRAQIARIQADLDFLSAIIDAIDLCALVS